MAYLLLKNKNRLETETKISQVLDAISIIVQIYKGASNQCDISGKKIMLNLETMTKVSRLGY